MSVVWYFNVGSEADLLVPSEATSSVKESLRKKIVNKHKSTFSQFLGENGVFAEEFDSFSNSLKGSHLGRAFLPTPLSDAFFRSKNIVTEVHPSFELIHRVNHRAFAYELSRHSSLGLLSHPKTAWVHNVKDFTSHALNNNYSHWLLKTPLSVAGRGAKKVASPPSALELAWLQEALVVHRSLEAVPFLELLCEFSQHGYVHRDSSLTLGKPTIQIVNSLGQWVRSERLVSNPWVDATHLATFEASMKETGQKLVKIGYFGPYNQDAFVAKEPSGEQCAVYLSDLNCRYSMGFAVGMGTDFTSSAPW